MITNLGRQYIRSYLAGLAPAIAQSISVGIRNSPLLTTNTEMGFEVARVPITSVSLDPETNKIVFKGTIEDSSSVNVYEIGLWSSTTEDDSSLVLTFSESDESWEGDVVDYVEDHVASRIGSTLMEMTVVDAAPKVAIYPVSASDLAGMLGPEDQWSIAFNKVGTAPLNIKVVIRSTDGSLELPFFPSNITTAGYTFGSVTVKDGVSTGSFDPTDIEQFDIVVTPAAGNSATSTVQLDGVVATNAPSERENSVMIARSLVSPAFSTASSDATDVEYELSVIV